ncbi:MAG: hypothetical protein EOP84_08815 [Verrucomicrobiaceae bacterium]|nr:MAG: hypothetical protein EOP84_08815 [Verrucomicrobiaceae bacterium]
MSLDGLFGWFGSPPDFNDECEASWVERCTAAADIPAAAQSGIPVAHGSIGAQIILPTADAWLHVVGILLTGVDPSRAGSLPENTTPITAN